MRILVSSHTPFIPIIQQLHAKKHEIVVMDAGFAQNLANLSIECKPVNSFFNPELNNKAIRSARTVMDQMDKRLNYKSCPISINGTFMGSVFSGVLDLCILSYVLDAVQPNAILVHNDVEPAMKLLCDWGRSHNIPSFHVPHSIYLPVEKGDVGEDIHDVMSATHVLVAGLYQAQWYGQRGMKNIIPLGLPQFDNLYSIAAHPKVARQQLGLDLYKPVLLYASSWRQDTNMAGMHDGVTESYKKLLETVRLLGDRIQLLVKVHPRGNNGDIHVKMAQEMGVNCLVTESHLMTCLEASSMVLCYSVSNLLFEATFFPWLKVACTHGFDDDQEVFKINLEDIPIIELSQMFLQVLDTKTPNYTQFREKYIGYCGDASSKIVKFLDSGNA